MQKYSVWQYLWPPAWLWRDNIWRRERPVYRELDYREGWYDEQPPFRELARRQSIIQLAFSSPNAVDCVDTGHRVQGREVFRIAEEGSEWQKLAHGINQDESSDVSDVIILRNVKTGRIRKVNCKYEGFGVQIAPGKFLIR